MTEPTVKQAKAPEGGKPAAEVVEWALREFHPHIALACSFSVEDVVLVHMMLAVRPDARIFSLDTGRLNPETYECAEAVRRKLKANIEWLFPDRAAVEKLEREKGVMSFRDGLDQRHECCRIRKVEPLGRGLAGLRAWITGLRREQAVTRADAAQVERDAGHGGIAKINPLVDWTSEEVWGYVRAHGLPYNRLHDGGYPSIGCAPCTRALQHGEHPRAGRWWRENPEHKECGLHEREWRI